MFKRTLIFLWAMPFLFGRAQNPAMMPLIFKESAFDFGSVAEGNGPVAHRFYFYNRTTLPLNITVNADCGVSVLEWTNTPVKPNKGGALEVSYDPKGKSGYFCKKISVQTDWFNFLINVQISGNVVRDDHAPAKWAYKNGKLRMQQRSVFFKQAYINKVAGPSDFALFNDSDSPVVISKIKSPPYLQVQLPMSIGARQTVNMSVTCDGAKKKLGYHRDTIELWTNDLGNKVKKIPVYAMIEEYFSPLSDSEFFKVPVAVLDTSLINFGIVRTASVTKNVTLKNAGLRELRIRDIIPNHFSILVVPSYKNVLQKNDTVRLKFIFTPYGQAGRLYKAAVLFTNDPRNPVQNILMTMECQ